MAAEEFILFKITTLQMEILIANYFNPRQNLVIPNISWGLWIHECDLLVMSKSGYLSEIEIKISVSDLKKDREKRHGHHDERIKALYFAIPEYLFKYKKYIPEKAGILVVKKIGNRFRVVLEKSPKMNKTQTLLLEDQFKVARLGALRIWTLKQNLQKQKEKYKDLLNTATKEEKI